MRQDLLWAFNGYASHGKTELPDGFCGPGSTMWYTLPLRTNLVNFLNKHNINGMLDAPCGDGGWMNSIQFPDNFNYIGAELHADMVERNNRLYGNKYIVLDITEDALPKTELIFVRDCLFHLTKQSKLNFFRNFIKSGIPYILTSNHPRHKNTELAHENSFFPINWQESPWNFVPPIDCIVDYDESDERFLQFPYRTMCLWSRDQIISSLTKIEY